MHARLRAKNPQRLSNFAEGGAAGGSGGGPYMQGFMSYIYLHRLSNFARRSADVGVEGIGNVTSTENSELLEVLTYQLEMETRLTPVN